MRKKLKDTEKEDAAEDYQQAVGDLAEAVVDALKDEHRADLEPFEIYAQKVRTKVHSNLNIFRKRFLRGYQVLIDEISKESTTKKESKEQGRIKP